MKSTISWFEIPVYNFEQAEEFYNYIFGIKLHRGEVNGNLVGVFTGGDDEGVHGAIVKGEGYIPCDHGPLLYLSGGDDLSTVLSKVEEAGGSIIMPKTFINKELGYIALFYDTEGNRIALHSQN
ncbi:MAG TPA: VOC family protein [Ignavibacteria bacterium]|jgi:hypothetical protein